MKSNYYNLFYNFFSPLLLINDDFIIEDVNELGSEYFKTEKQAIIGSICYKLIGRESPCAYCPYVNSTIPKQSEKFIFLEESKKLFEIFKENTNPVSLKMRRVQKALLNSEKRFQKLLESNVIGIILFNKDGNIIDANDIFLDMIRYTRKDLEEGYIDLIKMTPEIYTDIDYDKMELLKKEGQITAYEKEFIRKDKSSIHILIGGTVLDDASFDYICFVIDISEKKKAEEKLMKSLTEKEVLLKEIHHRVKNNLHNISSLLNVKKITTKNKETVEVISQAVERIYSIGLVHELLYKSNDFTKINFYNYLNKMIVYLSVSNRIDKRGIVIRWNCNSVFMPINKAIPCGLLINELISNSLKHAFKNISHGTILIDFEINDNQYHLVLKDNGCGLPENFDKADTFGLELIKQLVIQLEGKYRYTNDNGVCFELTFPG